MNKNDMEKMLKTASDKLGCTSDELRTLLAKGDMMSIMAKMNKSDAEQFDKALKDPKVAEKLKKDNKA